MESCPMPWKCQERKGRSEGEKEDGQRKKREEKRKGERMREIALLTIRRIFKDKHDRKKFRSFFCMEIYVTFLSLNKKVTKELSLRGLFTKTPP